MAIIDSPRVTINGLTLTEQTVVPATPSSGKQVLYTTASGLKLMNSSGSLVSIGGDSADSGVPSTISNLYLWLAADKITGLSDGNPVLFWNDASKNRWQTTSFGTVTYKTNILNSLPVLRFAGGAGIVSPFPSGGVVFCVFVVFKITSISQSYTSIITYRVNADGGGFLIKSNGKSANYVVGNYDGTGAITYNTTDWNYVTSNYAQTFDTYRNGVADKLAVSQGGGAVGYKDWSNYCMIGNHFQVNRTFSGDIAEVIAYNKYLSSSEITSVENYIKAKYNL